jgi:Ca2+/Na+ antiporter
MTRFSSGEVFGGRLLNLIIFIGAVAILIASVTGPSVRVASNPTHQAERAVVAEQS